MKSTVLIKTTHIYEKPLIPRWDAENRIFNHLSSFYMIDLEYNGKIYPSGEHLYQASKYFDTCPTYAELIRTMRTPYAARLLGDQKHSGGEKRVWMKSIDKHIDHFREVWKLPRPTNCDDLMEFVVKEKLKHTAVLEALNTTDEKITYHSDYDTYWAIKYTRCTWTTGPNAWWEYEGRNVLGNILTRLRKQYLTKYSIDKIYYTLRGLGILPIELYVEIFALMISTFKFDELCIAI